MLSTWHLGRVTMGTPDCDNRLRMATAERPTIGNHEVANQPPPLVDYNVFEADRPLVEAVRREGAEWAEARIAAVGAYAGGEHAQTLGRLANENGPKLRTHDRYGNRVDEVEFHPAWHELMGMAVEYELHSSPWQDPRPGAHVARGAAFMCMSQAEAGIGCPISMTYSVIPALRTQPELAAEWEPRFLSATYDPRNAPAAGEVRRPGRDGDDREAGRHRRPRQHHGRPPGQRRRARRRVRADAATSGSCRRRCATPSSSSPRPTAASPASSSRAGRPTASATASACSG